MTEIFRVFLEMPFYSFINIVLMVMNIFIGSMIFVFNRSEEKDIMIITMDKKIAEFSSALSKGLISIVIVSIFIELINLQALYLWYSSGADKLMFEKADVKLSYVYRVVANLARSLSIFLLNIYLHRAKKGKRLWTL